MANSITKNEYDKIKNTDNFSVVSFDGDKRTGTFSGMNYLTALNEILERQKDGLRCLVIQDLPVLECSRDLKDYDKYLNGEQKWNVVFVNKT